MSLKKKVDWWTKKHESDPCLLKNCCVVSCVGGFLAYVQHPPQSGKKTNESSQSNQNGVPAEFSKHRVLSMKLTFSSLLFVTINYRMDPFSLYLESPAGEHLRGDERSLPPSAVDAVEFLQATRHCCTKPSSRYRARFQPCHDEHILNYEPRWRSISSEW